MNKKNNYDFKRSYESDGIMDKNKKSDKQKKKENQKDDPMFFNITESSE